jgi:hypothetical protein
MAETFPTVTVPWMVPGSLTTSVAAPFTPSVEAVIVEVPSAAAVANPPGDDDDMVATPGWLELQVKAFPPIAASLASLAVAVYCSVAPTAVSVSRAGLTVTEATTGLFSEPQPHATEIVTSSGTESVEGQVIRDIRATVRSA